MVVKLYTWPDLTLDERCNMHLKTNRIPFLYIIHAISLPCLCAYRVNKQVVSIACTVILAWGPCFGHDVYLGRGEISLSEQEVSGNLTFDKYDLMIALEKWHGGPLYLLSKPFVKDLIERYLSNHFMLFINENGRSPLTVIDFGYKGPNIWIAFSCYSKMKILAMEIENRVLFNEFPEQTNTLEVMLLSEMKMFVFDQQLSRLKIL